MTETLTSIFENIGIESLQRKHLDWDMEYFEKCNWTRGGGVLTDKPHCPKPYGQFIYKEQCLVCTTDTIANRVVHSNNTFRSFIKQEPLSHITSTAMLTMLSLIVHLKWSSVCVIFDNETSKLQ